MCCSPATSLQVDASEHQYVERQQEAACPHRHPQRHCVATTNRNGTAFQNNKDKVIRNNPDKDRVTAYVKDTKTLLFFHLFFLKQRENIEGASEYQIVLKQLKGDA